ncbi:MAG: hypothetical protein QNJ04_03105 [Desulfobacterales bacterium]|nr:hypothetical protein [Desulfobacterales bacterium]
MIASGPKAAALALLFAALVSCADTQQWFASHTPDKPPARATKAPPDMRPSIDRARRCMQAGDYQKAIDTYHAAYRRAPHDAMLVESYTASLEEMATAADQALERQAIGEAGKTYNILLKNFARFEGFEPDLALSRTELEEKRTYCKRTLFRQGFQAYRQGDLDRSIALWEDYLVLDPDNADISEALRTARLQQKNLQEAN